MNRVTFTIKRLEQVALRRLPGYLDACRACAVESTADTLTFDADAECYAELAKYRKSNRIKRGVAGLTKAVLRINQAPKEVIAQRRAECGRCEHAVLKLGVLSSCGLCGCAVWAKTRNADEQCPATPPRWLKC